MEEFNGFNPSEPEVEERLEQMEKDFSDFEGLGVAFSSPLPDGQLCTFYSDQQDPEDLPL